METERDVKVILTTAVEQQDDVPHKAGTLFDGMFGERYIEESALSQNVWVISSISVQLGFPLKVALQKETEYWNDCIAGLFAGPDPTIPNFASKPGPRHHRGDFYIARCDGKDLDLRQFDVFYDYVTRTLAGGLGFADMPAAVRKAKKDDIAQRLTPTAFAAHVEDCRRKQVAAGDLAWASLDIPIQTAAKTGCAYCSAEKGPGGKGLQACSSCKKVRYCNQACQKYDWKAHKPVCKATAESESKE